MQLISSNTARKINTKVTPVLQAVLLPLAYQMPQRKGRGTTVCQNPNQSCWVEGVAGDQWTRRWHQALCRDGLNIHENKQVRTYLQALENTLCIH